MGSLIIQKPMKREGKKQATKMIFPFPAPLHFSLSLKPWCLQLGQKKIRKLFYDWKFTITSSYWSAL